MKRWELEWYLRNGTAEKRMRAIEHVRRTRAALASFISRRRCVLPLRFYETFT